ncbi:hypothetical protein KEM56_004925 [Ascosphaera pollenicola]|nr:hypothetical protein KEM56_004925 [Ascosphaera pollenicola]
MGLHQCQALFDLNSLETEMRRRAFWCQYVLDKFAAAIVSVPALLKDEEISCELPREVEYDGQITENGIISPLFSAEEDGSRLPNLNSQSLAGPRCHYPPSSQFREQQQLPPSPITAAIKLVEAASILGKTLTTLYSASVGSNVRISTMHTLVGQLDAWESRLPECLRPGPVGETQGIYATLLQQQQQQAQEAAASSIIQSVESSKAILRTLQYMDRKRINLSLCINKRELVLMASVRRSK